MFYCLLFMNNPQVSQKVPGDYYEIVNRTAYDSKNDQTYVVFARYFIDQSDSVHIYWMEPMPFKGNLSNSDILKTRISDPYIKTIGLE